MLVLRKLRAVTVAATVAMAGAVLVGMAVGISTCASASQTFAHGLQARVPTAAYLRMPTTADGALPRMLSQTGAFDDVRALTMSRGSLPYELAVPFWSDGADKSRWVAIPRGKVKFAATGEWSFPRGTVFVKTFELSTDARRPDAVRRLETRLLVCDAAGGVYGVDYKWRPDNSDADLVSDGMTETIPVIDKDGAVHEQSWVYPSRQDCLACHNANAGGVLGLKTRQMNRAYSYPSGVTDNELRAWNQLGLFEPSIDTSALSHLASLAPRGDLSRSLEDRARSYLDANCSQCHRPGGTVANFDARYDTPLDRQNLIDGPVLIDQGIDHPRVIAPHDVWRSIAFMRVDTTGDIRMPPLARETIDSQGVELLRQWIESLPGRAVLEPPKIAPEGGTFAAPVQVTLSNAQSGSEIRYTLDGSVPGPSDPLYQDPIELTGPAVLRTRAYKNGFTRSIVAQEVFIIGK